MSVAKRTRVRWWPLALVLLPLSGGVSAESPPQPRLIITVAQYHGLKERAEQNDELAGVLLGAYLAGLYAGISGADAGHAPRRLFCPPPGMDPELRELLNFVDEALDGLDVGRAARDELPLQRVLLDALVERFPCG